MRAGRFISAGLMLAAGIVLSSCKREERGFKVEPPSANTIQAIRTSDLQPGPSSNEISARLDLTNLASTHSLPTNSAGMDLADTNLLSLKLPLSAVSSNAPVKNEY